MSGDKDIDDEIAAQDDMIDDEYGDAVGEDEEFADEDWDSYDEEGGEGEEGDAGEGRQKKPMPKFNKIVIAGALGLGLCVVAFTMLTSKPAAPPAGGQPRPAQQQAQQTGDVQRQRLNSASLSDSAPTTQRDVIYGRNREENVIAPVNDNTNDEGGLLNDPSQVRKIEQYRAQMEEDLEVQEEQLAAEEPSVAVAAPSPGQDLPAATPEIVNQDPPMPVPGADSVLTPLPQDGTESVGLPRAQDLALPDDASADAAADVSAPVDAAPVAAFDDAAPAVEATDSTAAAPVAEVAELTAKIETLQGALDSQVAKVKELESTVQQLERALESRATEAPRASAPAKRKASSSASAAPKKSTGTVRWVLKSAQPGHAMVSRAGENEMRNVTVGDSLPGIGRVTQIYQSPTGWIVQGTDGRILQ